jgi:hypothetical protein
MMSGWVGTHGGEQVFTLPDADYVGVTSGKERDFETRGTVGVLIDQHEFVHVNLVISNS